MVDYILQTTELNDIDISSYIRSWTIEETFGNAIGQLKLNISKKVISLITPEIGQKIEVWFGWTTATDYKRFHGWVEDVSLDGVTYKIMAYDKLGALVHREVTYSYDYNIDASAGNISEIVKDLITTYGELTADATSIQNSGSTADKILTKYICYDADVLERCQFLAKSLDWQLYYRADTDKVYFEPKGYEFNANVLTVGSNVINVPKWKEEGQEIITDLKIRGSVQKVETTEYFTGDGSETTFTLAHTPESVKVYEEVAAVWVLRTGGKTSATSGSYDYTVDKENKNIIFESGSIPAAAADNVQIDYTYNIPTPVVVSSDTASETYQKRETTVYRTDVDNVTDATNIANTMLSTYSEPFVSTKLTIVDVEDLRAGQLVNIVDNTLSRGINEN